MLILFQLVAKATHFKLIKLKLKFHKKLYTHI